MSTLLAKIKSLSDREFENLTHDLMIVLGLRNVSWRSPGADGGRDIEGSWLVADPSGDVRSEGWYVECKRYSSNVSWPTVYGKLAYADSNNADILLLVTTASLTPACRTEVSKWNSSRRSLELRFIDGPRLVNLVENHSMLVAKYALGGAKGGYAVSFKAVAEILADLGNTAEAELDSSSKSVAADAMFELARVVSRRISELEVLGGFARDCQAEGDSLPPWIRLAVPGKVLRCHVPFIAYLRYLLRVSTVELQAASAAEMAFQVSLAGSIPFADGPGLREVAHWCQLVYVVANGRLEFGDS